MASFSFEPTVLDEGTTFLFGSWVCVADGSGGFNSHLADPINSRSSSPASPKGAGEALLPERIDEIDRLSVFDMTTTRSPTTLLGLDSIYPETPPNYTMFGLRNAATTNMTAMHHHLAYGRSKKEATTCWEAPIYDSYPDSDGDSTEAWTKT